jgi:hypothetical protein
MPFGANRSTDFSRLLSCCVPDGAPLPAGLAADDWGRLASCAERHGVAPLVANRLTGSANSGDGDAARERIVTTGHAIRLRNEYLTAQLIRLLDEMRRAALEVLAIKGPVLGAIAYGDLGLRSFADLDLLVRPADRAASAQLFAQRGLTADRYDEAAVASGFFDAVETDFQRPDGIVNVDLHWGLAPAYYRFGPDGAAVFARAIDVPVAGATIRTLGPEDHLLYLAVHASRHGWPALSHVADLAHFVARVALDWPTLLARAAATHSRVMLDAGLLLAYDLLGTAPPDDVLAAARSDARAAALAAAVAADLAQDAAPSERTLLRRSLGAIGERRDRVRYILAHGFAPTLIDWRFCPLPRPFYPAYYLLRPLRIGRGIVRRAFPRR